MLSTGERGDVDLPLMSEVQRYIVLSGAFCPRSLIGEQTNNRIVGILLSQFDGREGVAVVFSAD